MTLPGSGRGIAIVGMACRFPGASTLEEYTRLLFEGRSAVRRFSERELRDAGVPAAEYQSASYVPSAGALGGIELFDAAFFGMTPREAELTDPQHRVFLEVAWEAFESAGIVPGRGTERTGVFAGAGLSTYLLNNLLANPAAIADAGNVNLLLANNKDFVPARVSYKLDLRGPSVNVNTACSTSLVAVHLACQSLLQYECDLALAGGAGIQVPEGRGYHYEPGGILSRDGTCRPFDAAASGTVHGNGAGAVLLKRLDDALRDGDPIRAVLLGSAVSNDGGARAGFTAPGVEGQAEALIQALANAEVEPESVGYIEAHGTGTQVGDPIEVKALARAYASGAAPGSRRIGAVKSNIGHLDEAAGIAGLLKAVLALEAGRIPPTLHFEGPNPLCALERTPFAVNAAVETWPAIPGPRRAAVSSFGLGGTNAHAILEEAPRVASAESMAATERGRIQILPVSARTPEALAQVRSRVAAALDESASDDRENGGLAAVAWTLQSGRRPFAFRGAVVARSIPEAKAALSGAAGRASRNAGKRPRLVFLYPGQGVARVGMGRGLYDTEPVFRGVIDRAASILRPELGFDVRDALYPERVGGGGAVTRETWDAAAGQLDRVSVGQPAVLAIEWALTELLSHHGILPDALLGHSLGEIAAVAASGGWSFEDAILFAARRAALIESTPEGSMVAVAAGEDAVRGRLERGACVAIETAPGLCVISGTPDAVESTTARLRAGGIECRAVAANRAFHSELMTSIAPRLGELAAGIASSAPIRPVLANATGDWHASNRPVDPAYWSVHLASPVLLGRNLERALEDPTCVLLEVGPGRSLASPAVRHPAYRPGQVVVSAFESSATSASSTSPANPRDEARVAEDEAYATALATLWTAGLEPDWKAVQSSSGRVPRRAPLPTYPFDRKRHWIAPAGGARSPGDGERLPMREWFHEPAWRRVPLPPRPHGVSPRVYLVVAADVGAVAVADGIAHALLSGEPEVRILRRDARDLMEAVESMAGVDTIAWCAGGAEGEEAHEFLRLAALVRLLAKKGEGRSPELVVVTAGAREPEEVQPPRPDATPLLGLVLSAPQEHLHLRIRAIDLPSAPDGGTLATVARVLASRGGARFLAIRGDRAWEFSTRPVTLPAGLLAGESGGRFRRGGVYWITGGYGAVGRILARQLARDHGARIALTGRAGARLEADCEAFHAELKALGGEAMAVPADVTDEAALRSALDRIRSRWGRVDGVIHAAGVTSADRVLRPLASVDEDSVAAVFAPKIAGTRTLARVLANEEPDFVALLSSNASILGGIGFAAYAGASAFLDAFAEKQWRDGRRWISTNWDGWPDEGAPQDRAATRSHHERYAMTRDEAPRAFAEAISLERPRVVVSTYDLESRRRRWTGSTTDPAAGIEGPEAPGAVEAPAEPDAIASPKARAGFSGTPVERDVAALWRGALGVEPESAEDDFFALGGDSLVGGQLIARINRQFGSALSIRDLFEAPSIAGLAARLRPADPGAIPRLPDAPHYALSHAQRRLWLLAQMTPEASVAYNIPLHQVLEGPLDAARMERAFARLVERHESLRTTFRLVDGEPVQVVHPRPLGGLERIDLAGDSDPESSARALARAATLEPCDLERGPLIRATLARLGADRHALLVVVHHIVADGVSINLFARELARAYMGSTEHPVPALQYRDFAAWQNALLASPAAAAHRAYWMDKLGGERETLDLPLDYARPPVQTFTGGERTRVYAPDLLERLRTAARARGATLFMLLVAAVKVYLHRITGQEEIIVGSPSAGRVHADLEDQVGFYLNTLALRDRVDPGEAFAGLLERVARTCREAMEHEVYPFDRLVEDLAVARDTSRPPIFDAMVLLQNQDDSELRIEGLEVRSLVEPSRTAKVALAFNFAERPEGLLVAIEYNADLFVPERIERMAGQVGELLEAIAADPVTPVGALSILPAGDRALVLEGFQGPAVAVEDGPTIVDAFARNVAAHADRVAVAHGGRTWTYRQLDARANQAARVLAERARVGIGDHVGLSIDSGLDFLATFLGCLKLRAGVVLVEPSFPADRQSFMLEDSRCRALAATRIPEGLEVGGAVLAGAEREAAYDAASTAPLPPRAGEPDDTVMVFYTSGSTGRPKGVPLSNRGILNEFAWFREYFAFTADDVLPQKTIITFADSITEILLPITMVPGAVHLRPHFGIERDMDAYFEWIRSTGATFLQFVPSVFDLFLEHHDLARLDRLRSLNLSGSTVTHGYGDTRFRVYNLYGNSECTALTTCHDMTVVEPRRRVPIGKPLWNTPVYILDARLRPCPLYVPGEIYIGGPMVSRGYLERPDLTAERFVASPFRDGDRLFRTGDHAQWLEDGSIDFLGRIDNQVKVHGVRVECGEVEQSLVTCEGVRDAVVVSRVVGGESELVAYVLTAPGASPSPRALREAMGRFLPDFMIPAHFVFLEDFPRTSSGKIARRALPDPAPASAGEVAAYAEPRDDVERAIAAIWAEVLGRERVGLHDDFIAIGGHSLRATRIASRIRKDLGLPLQIIDIFRSPTVARLAAVLAERARAERGDEAGGDAASAAGARAATAEELAMLEEGDER